jgi:hypothetical protein
MELDWVGTLARWFPIEMSAVSTAAADPNLTLSSAPPAEGSNLRWTGFEVIWLVLIFFLFAGSPPPDAGESHYLVKAKHYWDPAWCAGDLFLESRDAHLTYYWTFGWLTRWLSLEASAWVGRFVTWGLLAYAWQRLSWAIVPRPLWSLLAAGLLLLFSRNMNLARELAIGGFEAKTVAYAFVFLALEVVARNRWRTAFLWTGLAGAFHVLVGGWMGIALGLAWLIASARREPRSPTGTRSPTEPLPPKLAGPSEVPNDAPPRVLALLPWALAGLILAMPGLAPTISLMGGVDPQTSREAARIYVFDRLQHHLVFHSFGVWYYTRHAMLLVGWAVLAWRLRRDERLRRVQFVILGALAIAAVGIAIDLVPLAGGKWLGRSALDYQWTVAPWLRLYWFRLEDALLPAAASLTAIAGIFRLQSSRPLAANWLLVAAMLVAGANLADVCYWRSKVRVPTSVIQQRPTLDSRPHWWLDEPRPVSRMFRPLPGSKQLLTAEEWLGHWQDCCRWIDEHTPEGARFLTPRRQQTFKWYAGRAEVASWKDIPQDAASIVAWRQTLAELYPTTQEHWEQDLAAFTDAELIALARKHECQYLVIDRTRSSRPIGLRSVYPLFREENPAFEIFWVPAVNDQ